MKTKLHLLAAAALILAAGACKKEQPADICPDCPVITSIAPASGAPGTLVTIRGINFEGLEYVVFDEDTQLPVVPDSTTATKTSVLAPDLGKNGPVKVTVIRKFSSGGGGTFSLESKEDITFTYLQGPDISGFSPQTGKKGDIITITGRFFGTNPQVSFPDAAAAEYLLRSDTLIQVAVPAKAGNGPLRVTSDGLTGTSAANYTHQYQFKVDLFLGQPGQPGYVVNVPASEARLEYITHIASDNEGNIYVIDQYSSSYFDIIKIDAEPPFYTSVVESFVDGECIQLFSGTDGSIYYINRTTSPTWFYLYSKRPGESRNLIYSSGHLNGAAVDEDGSFFLFIGGAQPGIYKKTDAISLLTSIPNMTFFGKVYNVGQSLLFSDFTDFKLFNTQTNGITSLHVISSLNSIHSWTYSAFFGNIYFGTNPSIFEKRDALNPGEQSILAQGLQNVVGLFLGAAPSGNLYIRRAGTTEAPCLYKATLE